MVEFLDMFKIFLRGLLMGMSDIMPGISGWNNSSHNRNI